MITVERQRSILQQELGERPEAFELFGAFLRRGGYDAELSRELCETARGGRGDTWEVKCLAVLMLHHQTLHLAADDQAWLALLDELGLLRRTGSRLRIHERVRKEGYSTTETAGFLTELQRHLARLDRIHSLVCGADTTERGLRGFLRLSRQVCKLTLARYLFTPDDVVEQALRELRVTRGIPELASKSVQEEMQRSLEALPEFETEIVDGLCRNGYTYWVSEKTRAEPNSLVEYPASTIAAVIKPPGSSIELEIKRCGCREGRLLDVVFELQGVRLSPEHRLRGVSSDYLQVWEMKSIACLSKLYRAVHAAEAPIPKVLSSSTTNTVPTAEGEIHLLDYFTDPKIFGEGYSAMRWEMKKCINAFRQTRPRSLLKNLDHELGQTLEFLSYASPTQVTLCDTSSFRLDMIEACLLTGSAPQYREELFAGALGTARTEQDEIHLADDVLEEVLGLYTPPPNSTSDYEKYLTAAFEVPANRRQADRVYRSLMQQIGTFWGTLLGVWGGSSGECFAKRNVGIRTCWSDGEWQVKILFMDHDYLSLPIRRRSTRRHFQPGTLLHSMQLDADNILGRHTQSVVFLLNSIYRISSESGQQGLYLLCRALKESFHKTRSRFEEDRRIQQLFAPEFVERREVWETLVKGLVKVVDHPEGVVDWRSKSREYLTGAGFEEFEIGEYLKSVEESSQFFADFAFLYS